jgi:hypothetical protein
MCFRPRLFEDAVLNAEVVWYQMKWIDVHEWQVTHVGTQLKNVLRNYPNICLEIQENNEKPWSR